MRGWMPGSSRFLVMAAGLLVGLDCHSGMAMGLSDGPDSAKKSPSSPADVQKRLKNSVIYGVVLSMKDGQPLSGVPIRMQNSETGKTYRKTSDDQGAFIFRELPPGTYRIVAGGGAFSVQTKEGLLQAGTVGEMDFRLQPLSRGTAELSGRIFEGKGSRKTPVAARLDAKNTKTGEIYTVSSDEKGYFDLKALPSGRYLVQVVKKGYSPLVEAVQVDQVTRRDFRLTLNQLAQADIQAEGNRKIRDTTGAISVIGQKKFQQNLTTGAAYTLMQNSPSIEYFSRSGSQGISGAMNYMSCRGYTVGGANTSPTGTAGIEISVEGVPQNIEADGGEIYDLGIMNTDVKSASIQRGVTTSRQTGNYAAGCAIDFHLVDPSSSAYQTINSGGGSYGLYYTSYINNSGINKDNGVGAYNDFTILHQDGFREFTPLTEYQYYGNLTKYLESGKLYFLATANYKNYDRGASVTLNNYNAFGPSFNGGASYSNPNNPGSTPNAPFYKNWDYGRFMLDLGFKDQVTPSIRLKNSLYAVVEPQGDTSMPAGFGSCNGTTCTPNQFNATSPLYQSINPNFSNQLGYQFVQNYYQAEGYKTGDIAEIRYRLWKDDNLYLGMKGQYATYHYYTDPMFSDNIVGGTINAIYSQTSIVGYLEDHYRPAKPVLLNVGFRVASVSQYFNDQVPADQWSLFTGGGTYTGGGGVGVSNGASMLIPMPHAGLNIYPTDNWKLYVTGGESFAPPAIFDYKGFAPGSLVGGVSPENVWDLSVGVRYSRERGYVAADLFSDYITNMPVALPFTSGTTTYTQYENVGQARQQGVEAEGKLVLGAGFNLSGNFTYLWGVLGNTPVGSLNFAGDMIPFVPLDMGNLALSWDHGPWHITVDERYTGMMNVIDFSGGPTGTGNPMINVPGYFTTDLYASYDLPVVKSWYKSASVYVDAFNLLNTNYYNPAGLEPGPNNLETLFIYPGEPVNVFAGVRMTF